MKRISILLALFASATLLSAQKDPFIPAILTKNGNAERIFIETADAKTINYRKSRQTVNREKTSPIGASLFFFAPGEFKAALTNYKNQNYEEALKGFGEARTKHEKVATLKGNYSTLAGFYEIECHRKLGKYEEMESLLSKFNSDLLTHETHKTQLKIVPLYTAVRAEDWAQLNTLCAEWKDREISGSIHAQVEYCQGLAQEGLGELEPSLVSFNRALVADYAASEVIVRKAALACLRVYAKHPEVIEARKLHGTPDEIPKSKGALLLAEAAAVTHLWTSALGRGEKLPAEFQAFSKYKKG